MTRIVIVDRFDVVRAGLREVLADAPRSDIVAEAGDGREALRQVASEEPDLLITGYSVPLINGVEIARRARQRCPDIEVLLFTQCESEAVIKDALRAGVTGVVLKSEANSVLKLAVASLCAGRPFFSPIVHRLLLEYFLAAEDHQVLTPREKSVLQLIAEGNTNKHIARILGLSTKTVETHRAATHRKLHLKSTASIVRYAVRNSILPA
jgi:DNA-binding NarL/FixJ family response regulator